MVIMCTLFSKLSTRFLVHERILIHQPDHPLHRQYKNNLYFNTKNSQSENSRVAKKYEIFIVISYIIITIIYFINTM